MKYLIVQIRRGTQPGERKLSRPLGFDSGKMQLYSTTANVRDGGIGRGEDEEEELWYVQDGYANELVTKNPDGFQILTEAEANAWLVQAKSKRGDEKADDIMVDVPERIQLVHAKLKAHDLADRGLLPAGVTPPALTQEDMDVLDPDKPTPGVTREKETAADIFVRGTITREAEPSGTSR